MSFIFFLLISLVVLCCTTYYLFDRNSHLKKILKKYRIKYSKIIDIDEAAEQSNLEAKKLIEKSIRLKANFKTLLERHNTLQVEVGNLEDASEMSEYGMYQPLYDFGDSIKYRKEINRIRDEQNQLIKSDRAILHEWHGMTQTEKRYFKKISKISLNAYNVECDNLILKVNYKNIKIIEKRMNRLIERMNRDLSIIHISINHDFHDMKKEELHLVHEHEEEIQEEKEEQKRIKQKMREEAEDQRRAKEEIEKLEKEAREEENLYEKMIIKEKQKIKEAMSEEKEALMKKIQALELSLEEAHSKRERAKSMAQQTKRGHVYVISNIGSFGPQNDIYKIGMTRRLDPIDRVKELGDSSVPFSFDVHAMIYTENAPALEADFHDHFNKRRVNKINTRKEFFKVQLSEIEEFFKQRDLHVHLTKKVEAAEYYRTLQMNRDINKEEDIDSEKSNHFTEDVDFGDDLNEDEIS